MITAGKIGTYIRQADGVERVYVTFYRKTEGFLGLKDSIQVGTMVLNEGVTKEEAEQAIELETKDYSDVIEFIPQLDDNGVQTSWFRARPKA